MYFNPAIEGKPGAAWILAASPYGVDQLPDYTTLGILAGTRADFPTVPMRGKPADLSPGLAAMQGSLGTQKFSYFTLAEMIAYAGAVIGDKVMQREIAPGQIVQERAPLYALLVRQMYDLGQRFGLTPDRVRIVYGFD